MQTLTNVSWDPLLTSLEILPSNAITRYPELGGLVVRAIMIRGGAPAATVGVFIPGAIIQNAISGVLYSNTGTTASPVWSIIDTATGGLPALPNGDIWIGNVSNVATPVSLSGDATVDNAGVVTVQAIQNFAVKATAPTVNGEVLIWDNVNHWYNPTSLSGDLTMNQLGVNAVSAGKITGAKLSTGVGYFTVSKVTNGTTPVNVIAATVPFGCVITGVYLISNDVTAGTITLADTAGTIATIAKGTVPGVMVGATSLANTTITAGNTLTIVSSSTGNATVLITFTVL